MVSVEAELKQSDIEAFLQNKPHDADGLRSEILNLKTEMLKLQRELEEKHRAFELEREESLRLTQLATLNQDTLLPLFREFMKDLGNLIEQRLSDAKDSGAKELKPFAVVHLKLDEYFDQIPSEQTKKILAFKTAGLLSDLDILKGNLYQGDRIEDFFIILHQVRNIDAAEVIVGNFIIPAISKSHAQSDGDSIQFSCYTGLAVFPFHGSNYSEIISNIEIALNSGVKNKHRLNVYSQSLGDEHRLKQDIRLELAKARNSSFEGFELRFQPFVDRKGMIIGCETLIRWNHPRLGFLSPNLFISLAERYGEMDLLGRWILYQACMQFSQWKQSGYELAYISVNLSPVQFGKPGLAESLNGMLDTFHMEGSQLKLEITEGTVMKDPLESIHLLNQFREQGIRIAVDDFGTGYSSLNYLMKLPINSLKIDKSFVDDMLNNANNKVVVRSIIDLAKNLDIEIIAEGVETKEQKDFLFDEGVQYIQGYYYSPPVTGEQFSRLLQENDFSQR